MRLAAVIVLASLLLSLLPFGSSTGETYAAWDTMSCGNFTFGCRATEWASVTVESCDPNNCTIVVNASAVGGANLPGTHQVHVALIAGDGTGGGACIGIPEVREAIGPFVPCTHVCDSFSVGWQGSCQGTVTVNLTVPRSGPEQWLDVYTIYGWNVEGGNAGPSVAFWFRQLTDGTVEISSCSAYTGCHGSMPSPPPRILPPTFPPPRS